MREYPKIGKTAKWGSAGLLAVVLAFWAVTPWRDFWYWGRSWDGGTVGQGFGVSYKPDPGRERAEYMTFVMRHLVPLAPWRPLVHSDTYGTIVYLPIWIVASPIAVVCALAWRTDMLAARRRMKGACPTCGYDRAGIIASSPCPECGAALVAAKTDDPFEQPMSPES